MEPNGRKVQTSLFEADADERDMEPETAPIPFEYREIPGYPGYRAGSDGTIQSCRTRGRVHLTDKWHDCIPSPGRKGHPLVCISSVGTSFKSFNKKQVTRPVHRLILEAFVGPKPAGHVCRHLNGNPADNRLENLCWGTPQDNMDDRFRHGTIKPHVPKTPAHPDDHIPDSERDSLIGTLVIEDSELKDIFRPIPGFPGYRISMQGRVETCKLNMGGHGVWKKTKHWKSKKLYVSRLGYVNVCLGREGKSFTVLVHRLVLEAFVGPCPDGHQCRHLNGNRADCRLANLVWDTIQANASDRAKHGTQVRGETSGMSKFTEDQVREMRRLRRAGVTYLEIAKAFGSTKGTVYGICKGYTWKHVSE